VVLAAGDTFRAAAADQLTLWSERAGVDIVRGAEGSDPGAVIHDAIGRASARHADLVIADTAGRRHTSSNLLDELAKIRRVADREPGQVVETILVLDATTGQNALNQAREFLGAAGVTGIALTKLDGTARGGIVLAVQQELGIPVKLVGVGEGALDLRTFEPDDFISALLGA
jgi:fused signal recognition particle receptor